MLSRTLWLQVPLLTKDPDVSNEELRTQIKTLEYELASLKQEKELIVLRHEEELRDAHTKAETEIRRAQVSYILVTKTRLADLIIKQTEH